MKYHLIFFTFLLSLKVNAQFNNENNTKGYTELEFKGIFTREVYRNLNKIDLGSINLSSEFFYSYKILKNGSVIFHSLNWRNEKIDTIIKVSFLHAVDSVKAEGKADALCTEQYVYIPVIILYQINQKEKLIETVPVAPFQEIFNWGFDADNNPEAIQKFLSPVIYRFPNPPHRAFE